MREILFRGKDYLCNWHYGSLIQEEYFEPNWEDLENPKPKNIYTIRYKNENDWVSRYKNIEVMPHTIGQYTGLIDKNGNKIFEGDILKTDFNCDYYKVYFDDCKFYIEDRWGNEIRTNQSSVTRLKPEIIGNIYDNPELLEVEG